MAAISLAILALILVLGFGMDNIHNWKDIDKLNKQVDLLKEEIARLKE